MITTILLLAALDTPSCTKKFSEIEKTLNLWSRGPRAITGDGEIHKYHRVTKKGDTYHMTIIEISENQINSKEFNSFKMIGICLRDNAGKILMTRIHVRG